MRKNYRKTFEELNLADDYMFSRVMADEEILKPVLEMILAFPIRKIELIQVQREFDPDYDSHGIRLDVYADDDEEHRFAIEMQAARKYNLSERSRYYHSAMDMDELLKGRDYRELKSNFVIFVCTWDPFGAHRYMYNFRHRCLQDGNIELDDGTETIFLNTEGSEGDIGPDTRAFLRYLKNSTLSEAEESGSSLIQRIHDKVQRVKNDPRRKVEYMKFAELMRDERETGREEGRVEGRTECMDEIDECLMFLGNGKTIEELADKYDDDVIKLVRKFYGNTCPTH